MPFVYGPSFILIAAYSSRADRVQKLSGELAESHHHFDSSSFRDLAEGIVQRDEEESNHPLGQNVRKVFPEADVFIDAGHPQTLNDGLKRVVELLFGNDFITPTPHEYCMFHASGASLRSASLQRQVGAAIATREGDIIAVGTNEVPKAGGGAYWGHDEPDYRDYIHGYEINDVLRQRLLADVLSRLKDKQWLSEERSGSTVEQLTKDALEIMSGARVLDVIEFGRCVHAEMAAIVDAARRGARIGGAILYSTTFPCHECARHIVAAGIQDVYYIEPYPKSMVAELYPDSNGT